MTKDEAKQVLEALSKASWYLQDGSPDDKDCEEACAIMRREMEPISDAEIINLWLATPGSNGGTLSTVRDFARALLEKAR